MATVNWDYRARMTTNAEVQQFVQRFYDFMIACGFGRISDTGQFPEPDQIGTITRPQTSGVVVADWVWGFGDSLQATLPIFLRTQIGTNFGNSTYSVLSIAWQVGTGTNGARTLTGQVSTSSSATFTNANGSGASDVVVKLIGSGSASEGRLWFSTTENIDGGQGFYGRSICVLERSRNMQGQLTDDAYCLAGLNSNGVEFYQSVPRTGSIRSHVTSAPYPYIVGVGPTRRNGSVGTSPALFSEGKKLTWLPLGYNIDDFGRGVLVDINFLGTLRTYFATAFLTRDRSGGLEVSGSAYPRLLLPWS